MSHNARIYNIFGNYLDLFIYFGRLDSGIYFLKKIGTTIEYMPKFVSTLVNPIRVAQMTKFHEMRSPNKI